MSTPSDYDAIYAREREVIERFCFDDQVASVFPDMITRSVPGYATIVEMIGVLAARYAQPGTVLYDLGCSLGAATLAMRALVPHKDCRIVAVDNAPAMIGRARELVASGEGRVPVEWRLADIRDVAFDTCSMAVMNFTLQFVPREGRNALMRNIADALTPGGILVLSEKIRFSDPAEEQLQQAMHYAFKRNNGYSDLEISQKRTALENVLVPETLEEHKARLRAAGFSQVYVWFRCFNFMSLVAVR